MVCYVMAWFGMVCFDMIWYVMIWYGMVWYGMVWYRFLPISPVGAPAVTPLRMPFYKQIMRKMSQYNHHACKASISEAYPLPLERIFFVKIGLDRFVITVRGRGWAWSIILKELLLSPLRALRLSPFAVRFLRMYVITFTFVITDVSDAHVTFWWTTWNGHKFVVGRVVVRKAGLLNPRLTWNLKDFPAACL